MEEFMGTHNTGGGGGHMDRDMSAMMLPHTSISDAGPMISPTSDGLTSPGYMSRTSSANDYVGQSQQQAGFLSHSALTGLAAAAAHHARFATSGGQSPGSNPNLMQGMGSISPGRSQSISTPQLSPGSSSNSGGGGGGGGGGGNGGLETSDMGSGGTPLSISYMRQGDNYVCSLCGKTVASKAAITRHIQLTHEKKKPFECNICHRRFGYKNILLEHQNIHFGIKPYSCNLCDKRFAARSNLFQHRLLHMKPFHCEVCNKRFDRADQLQRHLKLHPTSNLLSCNLCNFQATNVEALNNHLKESHTLQTYNTRSRFAQEGDPRGLELPTQVPLGPGAAAALALNLETEAMRKIDTICSQLASKGHVHIKTEPMSPNFSSSSHGGYPPVSPSASLSSPPFSAGAEINFPPGGMFSLPGGNNFQSSHTSGQRDEGPFTSPQHDQTGYTGDSPTSSISAPGFPRQAAGQFLTPSRRAASVGSIPGIQAFSRQNRNNNNGPPPSPLPLPYQQNTASVRSSADSTTNLSEFFSTLQGMIQRSQDIPELNVTISRPKTRQDASTQHNAVSLSGDVPSLNDVLVYYESQGKLYRCNHCKILFEERGMFFLHKSLHGEQSPWECSICHKVCADKNDFHLHFVNEQHQGLGH
ncbi:uncharacterized protein [Littorina saxatilis]|uniref:C2H2-type domain-containing protein n=1 Tax=Littorina saxatilis TaxID=31220 RepID=A0AAN9AUL0_9CAEN